MNILLLNDDALPSGKGGAAVVVERLRSAYASSGHTVLLVTTHQREEGEAIVRDTDGHGTIIRLRRMYPASQRHRRCLFDQNMHDQLDEIMREFLPDAVHAHNLHSFLTYDALRVAKKYTSHIALTAHDVFLVAFHRVNSHRYFHSVRNGTPYHMHWWNHLHAAGRKYWPLRNPTIRSALQETGTTVVPVSHALEQFLKNNGIATGPIVHNGAPITTPPNPKDVSAIRKRYNITGPVIMMGGRLSEDKGMRQLLLAFGVVHHKHPSAQLLLAAEPHCIDHYALPIALRQNIVITGWLPPETLSAVYAAADIVTTPSMCLDTFNLMNVEAMMAEKPVVGTIFGGTPEIVEHEKTGFVCDPRDTAAYANHLLALVENPQLASAMGRCGRLRAVEQFSMERQAQHYLKLLGV